MPLVSGLCDDVTTAEAVRPAPAVGITTPKDIDPASLRLWDVRCCDGVFRIGRRDRPPGLDPMRDKADAEVTAGS